MHVVNRPPTSIQLEPVLGCNMRCDFCPTCRLPTNEPLKFMSVAMTDSIGMEIAHLTSQGRHLRLDLALRGEPTLHPDLPLVIQLLRRHLPYCQMTIVTNGARLSIQMVEALFAQGLNFIYLDCYGNSYGKWSKFFADGDFYVRNSAHITHWKWHGYKKQCLILGHNILGEQKSTRKLVSFCKALPKKNCMKYGIPWIESPLEKRCADPFRSINITCNGNVLLCCRDWDERRVMMTIGQDRADLTDYWYHDEYLNFLRFRLYQRDRGFEPCDNCDYNGGVYLGNLPKPEGEGINDY